MTTRLRGTALPSAMSAPETATTAMGAVFPDGESRASHPLAVVSAWHQKAPRLVAGGLPSYGYLAYLEAVMDSPRSRMCTA
jgi:hypothetical protein